MRLFIDNLKERELLPLKLVCKMATCIEFMFFLDSVTNCVNRVVELRRRKVKILVNQGQWRQETCMHYQDVAFLLLSHRPAGRQYVRAAVLWYQLQSKECVKSPLAVLKKMLFLLKLSAVVGTRRGQVCII